MGGRWRRWKGRGRGGGEGKVWRLRVLLEGKGERKEKVEGKVEGRAEGKVVGDRRVGELLIGMAALD